MGICGPEHDWRSWTFDLDPGEVDPVLGIHWLRQAFEKAVPGYDKGVTVPAIVDVPVGAVVTADFRQITLDMEHEWTAYHRPGAPDLYPDRLRDEIEEVSAGIYTDVNNGVYRCGFATTSRPTRRPTASCSPGLTRCPSGSLRGATWSATRSPRPTSGSGQRWSGSTPSTRPLQVQPEQDHRDARAVGVRP